MNKHLLVIALLGLGTIEASSSRARAFNTLMQKARINKHRMMKAQSCSAGSAENAAYAAYIDNQPASESFNQAQDMSVEIFRENMQDILNTVADIAPSANK